MYMILILLRRLTQHTSASEKSVYVFLLLLLLCFMICRSHCFHISADFSLTSTHFSLNPEKFSKIIQSSLKKHLCGRKAKPTSVQST